LTACLFRCPPPDQAEGLVEKLDDAGLRAVADWLSVQAVDEPPAVKEAVREAAKN
jgi:hypothetical protein